MSELERLSHEARRLREAMDRARAADERETEERLTAELHVVLDALVPAAVAQAVPRSVLEAWLGAPDHLTRGADEPDLVEALCRDLEPAVSLPPAELDVAHFDVGDTMGGSTTLYLYFSARDGTLRAAERHTAFPE